MAHTVDVDELTARLYSGAPEDFVKTRGAGARELKAAGDTEAANEFARLMKPSVSAWAVNLLAVQRADLLDEIVARGDELRAAHTGGAGAKHIRTAQQARQEKIREATEAAVGLTGRQVSESHRAEIASTLEAVASDAGAASDVRAGRLVRPLAAPTGFAALGGLTVIAGGKSADRRSGAGSGAGDEADDADDDDDADDKAWSARAAMLRADADAALETAESAAATSVELGERVDALEAEREQLNDDLQRVDKALTVARREFREAERAALDAARKAARASSKAERAES